MFLRKAINGSGGFVVVAVLLFGSLASLVPAQNSSTPANAPEAQQKPTPTPKPKDEDALSSDDVVRSESNLTNIFFTAEDKHKRFISTLKQEDIRVLEDGAPQQIFTFQQNTDLPLSIAILVDCSISEERTLPEERSAAQEFLEAVLRPNKDEAAIVSFTGEVTLEQGFTGSKERLRRAIDRVEFIPPAGYVGRGVVIPGSPGGTGTPPISGGNNQLAGSTAIWDAVWVTSKELLGESAQNTRRAIILLTDGVDTSSQVKMHEAIEHAEKADALIYAIGIGERYSYGIDDAALRKITDKTGGRAYFPHNERELREAFAQIQRDLREQYLLAYSPTNKNKDGTYRRVQIEIMNPALIKELKLNYRQGYFAKAPETNTPPRRRP
jgi:VWFA-related protein